MLGKLRDGLMWNILDLQFIQENILYMFLVLTEIEFLIHTATLEKYILNP